MIDKITERDIFNFVFYPETLSSSKKSVLESETEFIEEIEFYNDLKESLTAELSNEVKMEIRRIIKTIPIVGQTVGMLTMPIIAGATTYAVGKVFHQHFASGGTFLTFDPNEVKSYYTEMIEKGKSVARSAA